MAPLLLDGLPLTPQAEMGIPQKPSSCARIRAHKTLLYAAHSGFGNQELSMRRALLLAYVLNRTLVLPPLLHQSDLSFGPPEVRCRNESWQRDLQSRATHIYAEKVRSEQYESLLQIYNVSELRDLGMRVVDFLDSSSRMNPAIPTIAPLRCDRGWHYSAARLRDEFRRSDHLHALSVGSVYFVHADLETLRGEDQCFDLLARATLRLPFTDVILGLAAAARARHWPLGAVASVHVRLDDSGVADEDAYPARQEFARSIHWLRMRMKARLKPANCCRVYLATNVPGGSRSPLFSQLCRRDSSPDSLHGAEPKDIGDDFDCFDQGTLGVRRLPEWKRLRDATSLSEKSIGLLVDQALGAAANRGFFSTSKFCGPPTFRRSTFSEGIALRWQMQHRPMAAGPLCKHAMERALLKGHTARGAHVF